MVKTLTVKCPQCEHIATIFLSSDVGVIILNCPSCYSPIMYFERKIFLLTKSQIETIKNNAHDSKVMGMLKQIVHSKASTSNKTRAISTGYKMQVQSSSGNQHSGMPLLSRGEKYITDDDIINLRIELELCDDSNHFIESLSTI